jgi:type I restriction enzyme S subunit
MMKTLGEVATYINGRAFKPTEWQEEGLPIIRIQNLNNPELPFNRSSEQFEKKYLVKSGDLLFAWSASLGAHFWHGGDAWLNQHIFKVIPYEGTDKDYLYYYLLRVIDELYSKTHGSGMVHITLKPFKETQIPLPSLPEQRRIVERIESLFEKLDRARELVQSALDSFETRKTAILHKAFTGELTAKWREMNGVGIESWKDCALSELCESFQYGTSKKSDKQGKVVVLRMGNLQNGEIDWKDLAYTSDEEDIQKFLLQTGDVLFNRTNSAELVGKTSVYRGDMPAIFAGYLIRINYRRTQLDGYYLNYVMNSRRAKEYCHTVKSDAVNQSNINAKKLAAFIIPYPILPEQQEIVRILDSLLEKEHRAKELTDVIDNIDLMKKAILARAFRGELGTNHPAEESMAEELCKGGV